MKSEINIIEYRPELREHIKRLNFEWLEKYFAVEESDIRELSDPEGEIIDKGGVIFYAELDGEIVGTASLLRISDTTYELAKMAVTEKCRGAGVGKELLQYCLAKAVVVGAKNIVLYSNRILIPALELYRKYGFVEIPMDQTHYKRADIKMLRVL